MDVARLNFSHGTHEDHGKVLQIVREESQAVGKSITVFQDLCGPKVRIGEIEGGETVLEDEQIVYLRHYHGEKGSGEVLFVEAFDPVKVVKPGEKVLLADGKIVLEAESIDPKGVRCRALAGGTLRSRSGISVPDSKLNLPCLTEKDFHDLEWGVKNAVDYVAISFVGSSKDVAQLRDRITALGASIPIIAKIERASSLDDIEAIVESADAVMVARGDLGLELPLERVPAAQKLIIDTANFAGRPVITATQMLVSMVNELRPTRAEVSDVCTAVRDGTDAVMLSEETAVGKHPEHTVKVLERILVEAEKEFLPEGFRPRLKGADQVKVADAICYAACNAAEKINASAIIACSLSGHTARLMSKYRPRHPLIGATPETRSLTRMTLLWGVQPLLTKLSDDATVEDEINHALIAARDVYGLKPGSWVVVTAGLRAKKTGGTNVLEIREVPRIG